MRNKLRPVATIVIVLCLICYLFSCSKNENYWHKFNVIEYEEYYEKLDLGDDAAVSDYIRTDAMNFTKVNGTLFTVNMNELHQESHLFIWAYALEHVESVTVQKISLADTDGEIIYSNNDCGMPIILDDRNYNAPCGYIFFSVVNMSEEWLFIGNQLTLRLEVQVDDCVDSLTYTIDIQRDYPEVSSIV